jgi:hypothetical protein
MVTLQPITLDPFKKKRPTFQEFLELQPKITPILAGTLAGLLGGVGAAIKTTLVTGLGVGILSASPIARKAAKTQALTGFTGLGVEVGKTIEDPQRLIPSKEDPFRVAKEIAKKGALPVAAAAGIIAAGVAGKSALEKAAAKVKAIIPKKLPSVSLPAALLPAPPSITPQAQPLGAVQKPKDIPVAVAPKPITIKNTFKPSIDISFRKSRRFINQQILVR